MADERREHAWVQLPEIDASRCEFCGVVVSNTAIGVERDIPDCQDPDLDGELALLLADA